MTITNTFTLIFFVLVFTGCGQPANNAPTDQHSATENKIISIVSTQIGIPAADISLNNRIITDLGADELDLVELIMTVEETFMIEITDEAVEKKLKGKSSGPRWDLTVKNLAELADKK